jgi:phage terminase large subunit-like protein
MSIEAGAIEGAGQTGGHFARIIYDDAETPKTVETAQSIEKAYNKIMLAINTGKTTDLNICFVGTFYARDDMYVKMIRNKVVIEAVIQPCCEKDGTPICYPVEILEKKITMMGPDAAYTQMFCDPSVTSSASFDPKWIKRWTPKLSQGQNMYIFVDPAGSKQKKTNDNTVIIAFGVDGLGNMMVHDMIRDKLTAMQKFQYLASFYDRYRPLQVFYEEESMQADIALMENFMDQFNMRFSITPFSMKKFGKKEHRISKLGTPFSRGKIYLPESAWHTNYLGKEEDMIASFISEEYMGFPVIQHDDALDILATGYIYLEAGYISAPLRSISSPFENDFGQVFFNPINNRYMPVEEASYTDCFEGML